MEFSENITFLYFLYIKKTKNDKKKGMRGNARFNNIISTNIKEEIFDLELNVDVFFPSQKNFLVRKTRVVSLHTEDREDVSLLFSTPSPEN